MNWWHLTSALWTCLDTLCSGSQTVSSTRIWLMIWILSPGYAFYDWLIEYFMAVWHFSTERLLVPRNVKILSSFVDKYKFVWRDADWPASWHISTKSYQWQWKCRWSLASCPGHHSVWMQFNVLLKTCKQETGECNLCTSMYSCQLLRIYVTLHCCALIF